MGLGFKIRSKDEKDTHTIGKFVTKKILIWCVLPCIE
jgi:hypothetical protein